MRLVADLAHGVQRSHDIGDPKDDADGLARLVDEVDKSLAVMFDGLARGPNGVPHARPLDLDAPRDVVGSYYVVHGPWVGGHFGLDIRLHGCQ